MDKFKVWASLAAPKRGQTMAEYALIIAAIATVILASYQTMGSTLTNLLSAVDNHL